MLSILVVLLAIAPAFGSVVAVYSDRASWESSLGGATFDLITFDDVLAGDYSTSAGLTVDGISILGLNGASYDLSVGNFCPGPSVYCWNSGALAYQSSTGETMVITPPGTVRATGFDLMTGSTAYVVTVDVSSGGGTEYYVPTFTSPARAFFGITTDSAITSIQISGPGLRLVDNIETADPTQTPEVMTMLLIGAGLIVLRILGRWLPTTIA